MEKQLVLLNWFVPYTILNRRGEWGYLCPAINLREKILFFTIKYNDVSFLSSEEQLFWIWAHPEWTSLFIMETRNSLSLGTRQALFSPKFWLYFQTTACGYHRISESHVDQHKRRGSEGDHSEIPEDELSLGIIFFFFLAGSRGQKSKTLRGKGVTTPEHLNHLMPQATAHLLVQRLEYQLLAETLLAKHSVCENLSKANNPPPKAVKLFPCLTLSRSETATWIHCWQLAGKPGGRARGTAIHKGKMV